MSNWNLRPMTMSDIDQVYDIINDFDEDDYYDARQSIEASGIDNFFVMADGEEVIGVTGFAPADGTDNTYWLEWTYLDSDYRKQGLGRKMLDSLFDIFRSMDCRKIFVSLSDYVDPEDGPIYADALKLYQAMGFKEDMVLDDFYDRGEAQLVYSYAFKIPLPFASAPEDLRFITLTGIFEIDESDDLFAIDWEFSDQPSQINDDLRKMIDKADSKKARGLMMTLPSNIHTAVSPLEEAGFVACGILADYFEEAVHETHYRYLF